ncbi:MAG: response regulator, partial [Oscillospiraceae bacterium]|nr:response regulator [Oscillospiraceae bacterium]
MKILLVDDEAGALRDLLRVMEKVAPGEEIVTARESIAALSLCGEQSFDVVFLDIKMPDMDG